MRRGRRELETLREQQQAISGVLRAAARSAGLQPVLDEGRRSLQALLQDTPGGWLSSDVRREVENIARLSREKRQPAAAALTDRLAADAVPVIPYGTWVQGEFVAPSVGCRVFPPFSYGVDLAALCPG